LKREASGEADYAERVQREEKSKVTNQDRQSELKKLAMGVAIGVLAVMVLYLIRTHLGIPL
jgi:hypothetical protein